MAEAGPAAAVVVAAGSGERFGGGEAKAFLLLAGEPLLVHAVRALVDSAAIDVVVVVVGAAATARATEVLDGAGLAVARVTAGGASREESVRHGLEACPPATAVVAVHDAARPLASPGLVARTVGALGDGWVAVAPGLPVVDTLKLVDDERVVRTVDRRHLWTVQTPQVFSAGTLRQVHGRLPEAGAAPAGRAAVTDDLALVERAGGRVRLIAGERRNLKITYPEDLALAEALLAGGRAR